MNLKKAILFITAAFLYLCGNAQVLHGRISDASGQPLAYASVYIHELRQGTTSNQEGIYEIGLAPGTYTIDYQFLGYNKISETVIIGDDDKEKDITLREQYYEIPAVRVSATGKDPAYYIIRKAIGMAPYHLNQVKMYKAEVYIKGGGKIDKLPKMLKKSMNIEANDSEVKEGQYYFTESVNIITFNAPDKYIHNVISSRSNMPVSDEGVSPMDYLQASFYQPVLVNMAISPLAPNAFAHYTFEFLGSTSQGDFVIDKIKVTPKRKSQQLFEGEIFIVEDLWAIHSLNLTNENLAGSITVRQLYTPVESGIWMPVSHDFAINVSIMGIKAKGSYNSAVKYLDVKPDNSLPVTEAYKISAGIDEVSPVTNEREREIEAILSKDEPTARDMSRLARLNEKIVNDDKEKKSLEVTDNTTYIIEEDALKKDSAYWAEIRPIPLTNEEEQTIHIAVGSDATKLARRDTSTLTISTGSKADPEPNPVLKTASAIVSGKKWKVSQNTQIGFNGLIDLKNFSFNTVDGFILGTGMSLTAKTGEKSRISVYPTVKYALSRHQLMWNINTSLHYNRATSGSLYLRAGSYSNEFSPAGVNSLVNSVSSLFFRENWMKLYESSFITVGHRGEIVNGLRLEISMLGERRGTLENNTSFSVLIPAKEYSENLPENPYAERQVNGFPKLVPVNHNHFSLTAEIHYTPRQYYRMVNGSKVNAGSDYPTLGIKWKHGYNYNDTLSGHYDLIQLEASKKKDFGALSEFSWLIRGGGFLHNRNLQLQDIYYFNTQLSPVLLNSYRDAFYLKQYYSVSSVAGFAEAHMSYTDPCILLKRIPGLSRTLMRENLNLSLLWAPDYGFYAETGYSISEIFFLARLGIYTGFSKAGFESAGIRLIMRFD